MRNLPAMLIAFFCGMSFFALISWKLNEKTDPVASRPQATPSAGENNMVIGVRKLKLKSGTSAAQFEKFVVDKLAPENGKLPGWKEYVLKGERGDDVGTYLDVLVFDSKQTRNFYFPAPGKVSEQGTKLMASLPNYNTDLDKMIQVTPTDSSYTDYVMLYQ